LRVVWGLVSGCTSLEDPPDGICEVPFKTKRERCNDAFTECLGTRIQSMPSGTHGHSMCHVCQDFCMRNNGVWPGALPDGRPCR
jgi:hypothetical protein